MKIKSPKIKKKKKTLFRGEMLERLTFTDIQEILLITVINIIMQILHRRCTDQNLILTLIKSMNF